MNEIKKELYRIKPMAFFQRMNREFVHYQTKFLPMNVLPAEEMTINFQIPISDIGEAEFGEVMPAQLLIRWIVADETM